VREILPNIKVSIGASKDGIDFNGHYDGGEIYWFRPIPEDHYRDQMEESIHDFMAHREPLDSEIR